MTPISIHNFIKQAHSSELNSIITTVNFIKVQPISQSVEKLQIVFHLDAEELNQNTTPQLIETVRFDQTKRQHQKHQYIETITIGF